MVIKKILTIIILGFLLVACSTRRTPFEQAEPISWERALTYQEESVQRNATIQVIRDEGMVASGCYLSVGINKKLAARLGTGEAATFHVEPGTYELSAGLDFMGGGLCSFSGANWRPPYKAVMQEKETQRFRLGWGFDEIAWIPVFGWFAAEHREHFLEPYDLKEEP